MIKQQVEIRLSWPELLRETVRLLRVARLYYRRGRYEERWRRRDEAIPQQVFWTRLKQQFAGLGNRSFYRRFRQFARTVHRRTPSALAFWKEASIPIEPSVTAPAKDRGP